MKPTTYLLAILLLASCSPKSSQEPPAVPADYILKVADLPDYESEIDHATLLKMDAEFQRVIPETFLLVFIDSIKQKPLINISVTPSLSTNA